MTTAKTTIKRKPWKIGKNTLYVPWRFVTTIDDNNEEKLIAFLEGEKQEVLVNGSIIAEAGTVYHETGLTPRQLDDQRRELLEALENVLAIADRKHDAFDKAHKAITKAKGESC